MAKRVTVVLDDEVVKKLRKLQVDRISKEMQSVSLSKVVNEILSKNMRK